MENNNYMKTWKANFQIVHIFMLLKTLENVTRVNHRE